MSQQPPDPHDIPSRVSSEDVIQEIRTILNMSTPQEALPEHLAQIDGMIELHAEIWGLRKLALAISQGDLNYISRQRGFTIGALKALQANLRHLTWQAQCIARGEFQHRVKFLGEFSTAFNSMTEQLENTIAELQKLNEKYREMSYTDPLTGVFNRRAFMDMALGEVARCQRKACTTAFILTDIDFFKKVNDTYGHAAGDIVLCEFTDRLRQCLRTGDVCGRIGGEEFTIMLPETPLADACMVAERLRLAICATPVFSEELAIPISASFGVHCLEESMFASSPEQALTRCLKIADEALYRAKEQGRNCVVPGK